MKKFRLIWLPVIVLMGIQVVFFNACHKDEEEEEQVPGLTTASVYKVTDNSAVCGGNVILEGSSGIIARGVCWCCNNSPTTADAHDDAAAGTGEFVNNLTGLTPNTWYYVRAFATNVEGTAYGNEVKFKTPPLLKDIDNNLYHTVIIGDQTWMAENLKVTHFRNGDPIPEVIPQAIWRILTEGAYCELPEDFNKGYGKLYNFYAIKDIRNIAPDGWHVATDQEWKILEGNVDSLYTVGEPAWDHLGFRGSYAGGNLKSMSESWNSPNLGATDKFGFSALPGGWRDDTNQGFVEYGKTASFWTSTPADASQGYCRGILSENKRIYRGLVTYGCGGSVRCVKDISE